MATKAEEIAETLTYEKWINNTSKELAKEYDCHPNTITAGRKKAGLPDKCDAKEHLEWYYGVPAEWLLHTLHNTLGKSLVQIGEETPLTDATVMRLMDRLDTPRRNMSEAALNHLDGYSEKERKERMQAALEARRQQHASLLVDDDNYMVWRDDRGIHEEMKVHTLLAIAEFGFEAVAEADHIHHEINLPYANWHENLRLYSASEHANRHAGEYKPDLESALPD